MMYAAEVHGTLCDGIEIIVDFITAPTCREAYRRGRSAARKELRHDYHVDFLIHRIDGRVPGTFVLTEGKPCRLLCTDYVRRCS